MTWNDVPPGSPFPLTNLPLGIGHTGDGRWRAWVAVGESALDLAALAEDGVFAGTGVATECFSAASLNGHLAEGPDAWAAVRRRLIDALGDRAAGRRFAAHAWPLTHFVAGVPVAPVDYVDFYSSIHHASNLGRLFRPGGEPLLPNWRRLPVGYHGRCGTLVPDGAPIWRPRGLRLVDDELELGPSTALDIELEVGTVVGVGSERGHPVPIDAATDHLYGMCLVNDWSARDIQSYEYQPLGPLLGKSFATSVSPWLVSFEALAPFRVPPPPQVPAVAAYLATDVPWGIDLHLEVWIESAVMRARGLPATCVSRASFADMYWTPAQQLAHLTVNGASVHAGDLFASGTVSGPTRGSEGSLIELTWRGERPIVLPDGTERAFLLDGDRVELRGWAGDDPTCRIGLGSVSGTVFDRPVAQEVC